MGRRFDANVYMKAVEMNAKIKEWIKNDDRITSVDVMEQIMEEEKPEWFDHIMEHPNSRRIIWRYLLGQGRFFENKS